VNRCHRCKMKQGIMPSGITTAFGQQTAASQARMSQGRSRPAGKARRARGYTRPAGPVKRRKNGSAKKRAARGGGGRLRKGSPAAKAWGRRMRRLRKK